MLALVLPDPGTADPLRVFQGGLNGLDSDGGFVTTPRRGRFLAPLGWRRNGFAATDTALLMRSGRWWRQLVVVPHQRTQSMALHQGPLARRFGLADLVLHTTAGPVHPARDPGRRGEALALFDAQAARARAARKRQTSEHWLAQVAPLVEQPPLVEPGARPLGSLAELARSGSGWGAKPISTSSTSGLLHPPQQEGPQRG